jgi:hypothetical protein
VETEVAAIPGVVSEVSRPAPAGSGADREVKRDPIPPFAGLFRDRVEAVPDLMDRGSIVGRMRRAEV